MNIDADRIKEMIFAAAEARKLAYAPYSRYTVGAALLARDSNNNEIIFTGCNIENAAYTPSNCAERTAVFKAVSGGIVNFIGIAIIAGRADMTMEDIAREGGYVSPCGVCRQVLREFVSPADFTVIMARSTEDYQTATLEELFPNGFGPDYIK